MTVLLATLAATPFTVRLLGTSAYGTWALLQLSLEWAFLADLGMATTSTKFAAERFAKGDAAGETAVVWTALVITTAATALAAATVAIWAPSILVPLLHVHRGTLRTDVLATRVVCALFLASSVAGIVNTPQVVRLRFREYTLISQGANVLTVVGVPIALALVARGVVTAAIVALAAATLAVFGNCVLAVRLQPALLRPRVSRQLLRPFFTFSGALTLASLATIFLTTGERFVLALNRSPTIVAYYALAASLGTILAEVPQQLTAPLLPGLVRLDTTGQPGEHDALYTRSLQALFLTIIPAALLLALLAHPFLSLWAGTGYAQHSTGPFFLILAGVIFTSLATVPYTYLLSSGRTKAIAAVRLAEVLPYFGAAAILTSKFGAIGAALTWMARSVIDSVIGFGIVHHVARLRWSPLPTRRVAAILTPALFAGALAATATATHGLLPRAASALVLATGYAFVTWRVVLTAEERSSLLALLVTVFPGLRRRPYRPNL